RQLLLVEVGARELEAGDADEDDAAALPAHLRRLVDRLVAARRRGDEDGVDAAAARERLGGAQRIGAGAQVDHLGAEALGERELGAVEVDAEDAAAMRTQQLHRDETDQAEAGDDDRLAERRLDEADAL